MMSYIINETIRHGSLETNKRAAMRGIPIRISLLALFSLFLGAGVSFCQSTSPTEGFAGNWNFTFAGGLQGNGTMTVSRDGNLSVYVSIGRYRHLFTNPVSLRVADNGALHGDIFLLNLKMGVVFGMFSSTGDIYGEVSTPFLDVGMVAGRITRSSGNGTYQSVAGNGTWTAMKN